VTQISRVIFTIWFGWSWYSKNYKMDSSWKYTLSIM